MNQWEELDLKASLVKDESVESSRRILKMCVESQDVGEKTLEILSGQGEQLNNIEQNMDKINAEAKLAEKHLGKMEKWCGLCTLPWKRSSFAGKSDKVWKANYSENEIIKKQPSNKIINNEESTDKNYKSINLNDEDPRQSEIDENLDNVTSLVGNLKNIALDMNSELENQNKRLDRVNKKAEMNQVTLSRVEKRAYKLAKK